MAQQLKVKWRRQLQACATTVQVYAPKYGHIQLVVVKNGHGNWEYLVTNAPQASLTTVGERKRSGWLIETVFRNSKQFATLEVALSAGHYS